MANKSYILLWCLFLFLLWNSALIYPLKILTVFFHESSHALMTILTGGNVLKVVVTHNQGGYVLSSGGSRFLILSAGYLGSLFWGMSIYILAVRYQFDKQLMIMMGFIIILITIQFIRNLFGLGFSLFIGLFFIILGMKAPIKVNDLILKLIGLTSIMYVPLDIYGDTIVRSNLRSDARMLAEEIGGSTIIWGVIWLVISSYLIFHCLRIGEKK